MNQHRKQRWRRVDGLAWKALLTHTHALIGLKLKAMVARTHV